MKLLFISNALTPHQKPLCDAFSNINDLDFSFIEMENVNRASLPIGWRSDCLPDYVVSFSDFIHEHDRYLAQILEADAVVLGGDYTHIVKNRLEAGGLTFVYSERIYKSTRDRLKMPFHYIKFRKYVKYPNLYLLCASAFSFADYNRIGCFKNKAYKWGYFINSPLIDSYQIIEKKRQNTIVKIIWIARFISWKHPELPVYLAQCLKKRKIKIEINMYGSGPETEKIRNLITSTNTSDCVHLRGELPNYELMEEVRNHDIFIFTSDKNEGWGVVANEAMANACALVGSSAIGSIPFLVENGVNGLIYEDGNLSSLENCVLQLINDPLKRECLSLKAYNSLSSMWSPKNAADRFIRLVNHLYFDQPFDICDGPCSKAEILSNHWYKSEYDSKNL